MRAGNSEISHEYAVSPCILANTADESCEGPSAEMDSEEAQESKGFRREYRPSPEEVKEHELTHLPFRIWCKHCIFGKAKSDFHMNQGESKHEVPKVSWDYMFMNEGASQSSSSQNLEAESVPIVVWKDSESKAMLA